MLSSMELVKMDNVRNCDITFFKSANFLVLEGLKDKKKTTPWAESASEL
jgi:hypothetical protein